MITGGKIDYVEVKRDKDTVPTGLSINVNVEEVKVEKGLLQIKYTYTVNYDEGVATLKMSGVLFAEESKSDKIVEEFKKTKKLFISKVLDRYLDLDIIINTDTDYKSLVFEWVQKNKTNLIFTYNEEYDFDSRKSVFSTTLFINREEYGKGQGDSKKEAEQEASSRAWERIKDISADLA